MVMVVGFIAGGEALGKVLAGETEGLPNADVAVINAAIAIFLVIAIHFGFTIWLGSVRGDARANRFGEAPKF